MTQEGGVLGTPAYMSPEQLRGLATIDRRADIYSMGATLYQMLTGVPPVDGDSLLDIGAKVLAGEVERSPRRLRSDVPDWLDEVVVRAMAAKPADRFQGAVEMREALVTPTAPPPPPRARAPDAAGAPHGHHASSLEPYTPHAPFAPAPPPRASHARDVPLPGAPSPGPFYDAWNAARAPALAEDPIVEPPAPVGTQITAAIPVVHAPASSSDTLPAFEPTVPASEAATPEPLVAVSALETGLPAGPEFSPRGDDAAYPSEPPAPPRPAQARSKLRAVGVIALAVVLIPFGLVVLLGVLALLAFPRLGATQYTVSASASAAPSGGDAVAASAATAVNAATGAPFG
jgi:hypothetical protein